MQLIQKYLKQFLKPLKQDNWMKHPRCDKLICHVVVTPASW